MEDYTERYSGIRVTRPLLSMEDVRTRVGTSCVFNVDRVRYRDMKGKQVLVIGVVVDLLDFKRKKNVLQATLWNFGMRNCSVLLDKELQTAAVPISKGVVLLVANPSLEFHNNQLHLMCESQATTQIIGFAKDYGVCGHTDKDNEKCKAYLDKRCGVLCSNHSKVQLDRLQRAQSMRPELKGSWTGLNQTYGFLESRGGKKRNGTFIGSPGEGWPVSKMPNRQNEEKKLLELAEKTQSRASKLALLGCVENMRGLRKGSLKEKHDQDLPKQSIKMTRKNSLPSSRDIPQKEIKTNAHNIEKGHNWEIDIVGYSSDQNSHSFWLDGKNSSPFAGSGTPCSKYYHRVLDKQTSPSLQRIPPIWEDFEADPENGLKG